MLAERWWEEHEKEQAFWTPVSPWENLGAGRTREEEDQVGDRHLVPGSTPLSHPPFFYF